MIAHVAGLPIEEALPAVVVALPPVVARLSLLLRSRRGR
jgi:hypothetical protein